MGFCNSVVVDGFAGTNPHGHYKTAAVCHLGLELVVVLSVDNLPNDRTLVEVGPDYGPVLVIRAEDFGMSALGGVFILRSSHV